jgi:hypothetical protein
VFDRNEAFHDLGRLVYGLAGIALGVIGLVWRDFAAVWQPIENLGAVTHREALACVFAVGLLSAGVATMWRRTARAGLLVLAALHFISALGWVPRVIGYPGIYGTAMMLGFGALVWAPALFAKPGDHITWAGNAITLALAGAAWVIADSISGRKQIRSEPGRRSADAAGYARQHGEPAGQELDRRTLRR